MSDGARGWFGVSPGAADWLTHDAAEELLSGRPLALTDRQQAAAARRLARVLHAVAADPSGADPLDPLREEEAVAAFRAARAARVASEERVLGPGEPGAGGSFPEPVLVGGRGGDLARAERAAPVRRTRRIRVGRSTRIVLAAAASVGVLTGVAVAVASVTGQAGGRVPVRQSGSSVPVSVASHGAGTPDAGVSGVTGHHAVAPGQASDPGSHPGPHSAGPDPDHGAGRSRSTPTWPSVHPTAPHVVVPPAADRSGLTLLPVQPLPRAKGDHGDGGAAARSGRGHHGSREEGDGQGEEKGQGEGNGQGQVNSQGQGRATAPGAAR